MLTLPSLTTKHATHNSHKLGPVNHGHLVDVNLWDISNLTM